MVRTQMYCEVAELLKETGVAFKWWKSPSHPFDRFAFNMEIIDIWHFYLSYWMLEGRQDLFMDVPVEDIINGGPSLFDAEGHLCHEAFNYFVTELQNPNIYHVIELMVAGGQMSPEEFCGMYAAKATLNSIRMSAGYKEGRYVNKPADGVEDTARLEYIVDAFVRDENFDLNQIKASVLEEFFDVIGA